MSEAAALGKKWKSDPRWKGISRSYSAEDVLKLSGTVKIDYTLARLSAEKLWRSLHKEPYVPALGAVTGTQAVQMVQAGLKAIYCSGWQVAADANTASETYPDQSLYPADSVPTLVRRINKALQRADQIQHLEGKNKIDWMVPIIADAEAGFGGILNVFEILKAMVEAGTAGVHLEDQLASVKKCGHMGGKVLVPTGEFERKLVAARLACDVLDAPTILIARTDALSATLISSDWDERDKSFLTGERTSEGFFRVKSGLAPVIARALVYAPYADMLWYETQKPDLEEAKKFSEAVLKKHPHKLLAYNCSPSFNWKKNLDSSTIAKFQQELGKMGYQFQFVTLAGFHSLNFGMFQLSAEYKTSGIAGYSQFQEEEFKARTSGYQAVEHQAFVGTGYFDAVNEVITGGKSATLALEGSTAKEQF